MLAVPQFSHAAIVEHEVVEGLRRGGRHVRRQRAESTGFRSRPPARMTDRGGRVRDAGSGDLLRGEPHAPAGVVLGDPAPPVVLVHGAYDHGRTWDGFASAWRSSGSTSWRSTYGHGDSGRLSSGMAWNACTIDLCELARVLAPAADAPIGMVGHSMGGGQVLTAAATTPERFAWLVNLDGLGPPAEGFVHDGIVDVATRSLDEIDTHRSRPPRPWASREQLAERTRAINIRLPRPFLEHLVEHGTVEVQGGFVWKWDPMLRTGVPDGFSLDLVLAQYRHVTAPTLVLVSSEDDTWTEVHDEEAERRRRDAGRRAAGIGARCRPLRARRTARLRARPHHRVPRRDRHPPVTDLLVLHDHGAPGGAEWDAAFAGWPGRVLAPDLPGHDGRSLRSGGTTRRATWLRGALDLLATNLPTTRRRVGVGHNGAAAQILALGGRAAGLVLDRRVGWSMARACRNRHTTARDAPADPDDARRDVASRPGAADPRATMVVGAADRAFAVRQAEAMPVPVLLIETPSSPTPDTDDLVGHFAQATLARINRTETRATRRASHGGGWRRRRDRCTVHGAR